MLAVAVVTYLTANMFLGLFDEVVLALVTCLCIDLDLHDGEAKFGPPTFHDSTLVKGDKKPHETQLIDSKN
jgi:hypothetical protein